MTRKMTLTPHICAGLLPTPSLTDPDVRISRIRFFARKLCSRRGVLMNVECTPVVRHDNWGQ